MKPRCGHRADDVERGVVFAWRMREASTVRLGLAILLTLGLFVTVASTTDFLVRGMSLDASAPRSDAVRILPWSQVGGTALEEFVEKKSPARALDLGPGMVMGVDDWLAQLGEDTGRGRGGIRFLEAPELVEEAGDEGGGIELKPEWTLPEPPAVDWHPPKFVKARWQVVVKGGNWRRG